jgi:Pyruvate/2-oxoacid:ferredoxin oxidoreductase delta subunit
MINSFGPCMAIDIETGLPLMGSREGYGWLSGTAIRPLAVRCVYDAAKVVKIPIFGVGGIATGRDAVEMIMAGASAVQVCTAGILKGPGVYGKIVKEMEEFLDSHGYADISTIKGLAHRKMAERPFSTTAVKPVVDKDCCNLCGLCETSCMYRAITRSGELLIDDRKCFGCGLCVTRCPKKALSMAT